jgi:fatty acid CoA ligase FadD36
VSILDLAAGAADRIALTIGDSTLTRGELYARAAAVADRIAGASAVAIEADASLRTIVAVTGCLLAGVPAVPVPADSGPRERRHILTDSGAQLWIGGQHDDVELDGQAPTGASPSSTSSSWTEPTGGVAMIMYTSGTTGAPKGVPIQRSAISACLDGLAEAWEWTPDDRLVHGLPLFHVHGLILGVLGPLRVGSPLTHTGRPTPSAYARSGGSLFFGVPTVWTRVAADPDAARALSAARLLVSGSAGLPRPVFEDLSRLCGQGPIERYGMTETLITLSARAQGVRTPGWVGSPLAGTSARVIGPSAEPVSPDGESIGDLQVRGPSVFEGYLGQPEATAAAFTDDGWFRTGDAAVRSQDGSLRIVGRIKDDLIKTGGYRVGAGEIEAALLEHPSVAEAAVVGEPDPDLGQRIVAYVVGTGIDADVLIEHVARQLSVHKRPREVRQLDALPRNAMGKVQKSQLR